MHRILLGLGVLALGLALLPARADDKADSQGRGQLFNGKDLAGWKLHPKPGGQNVELIKKEKDGKLLEYDGKLKNGDVVPLWRVEDGTLIGSGPASHLFSEGNNYQNFRYRVEAQINDK